MIDLSVLICSVHKRYNTFLINIERQLFDQYAALSVADQDRVEILIFTDNKKMILGRKRNVMVNVAQGDYIAFVDDDDRVSSDYIQQLLNATGSDTDSIVFQAEVTLDGGAPKICYYSKDFQEDYDTADSYYRIPNHICCIRRLVALESTFPNVLFGEDAAYSKDLLKRLNTELVINKTLYYYDYNSKTTETRG